MRIRTIKPELFSHEGLFDLERELKLPIRFAWAGLFCCADREGRFKWEPRRLGALILPFDGVDFSRVLDALLTRGMLVKYRAGDAWYGAIPTWKKHQFVNPRESASEIPPSTDAQEVDACVTREPRVDDASRKERKGKEGKGKDLAPDKPARARDPLFDALAAACGADPTQMTARQARACGVALAEIRNACPSVDPPEFGRRAEKYRRLYRDVALTPSALCAHWAECGNGVHPTSAAPGIPEPPNWRARLHERCPEAIVLADSRPWEKLPRDQQQGIASALA